MIDNLLLGVQTAFSIQNIIYCFLGTLIGTLVGILPGLGPAAGLSLLLPFVLSINDPTSSIILLAGVYYGTTYGGSATSILLKLPGEASSVVTCLDGNELAKKGMAGPALSIAALGSFFAGTIATILIAAVAVPLAEISLDFGPWEYTMLLLLALTCSVILSYGKIVENIAIAILGMLIGLIGIDINTGIERFTFNSVYLIDGFTFASVAMGLFGIAEIIDHVLQKEKPNQIPKIKNLYPTYKQIKTSAGSIFRGTTIGSLLGSLPGVGSILPSFLAYFVEKKFTVNIGQGKLQGVASPESANNAAAQTSFIPMLSLGLPSTPIMAIMISALMINDIEPGPQVIESNPDLFWGLIVSMWLGNLFLLILNLPLIRIWVKILYVPKFILYPLIVMVCTIGSYYLKESLFDVLIMFVFGLLGLFLKKQNIDPIPLIMGFVIGVLLEEYLRKALILGDGDWLLFVNRPICFFILLLTCMIFGLKYFLNKTEK
jgi:TctA family transporter